MALRRPTYRVVDGEQIPGTWRHVFIRNAGTYFLADLVIYADGLIDCWDHVDLDGLRERLKSGWVATQFPKGGQASAHHLATWTFAKPQSWISPDDLLLEVADTIEQLNGRPDSTDRCLEAVEVFRRERTEANRRAIRDAYFAIPRHMRRYALGDMDSKDRPLRVLMTPIGERPEGFPGAVTAEHHEAALRYFDEQQTAHEQPSTLNADGPQESSDPTVTLHETVYPAVGRTLQGFSHFGTSTPAQSESTNRFIPLSLTRIGRCRQWIPLFTISFVMQRRPISLTRRDGMRLVGRCGVNHALLS